MPHYNAYDSFKTKKVLKKKSKKEHLIKIMRMLIVNFNDIITNDLKIKIV